jgi:hypothetical protein
MLRSIPIVAAIALLAQASSAEVIGFVEFESNAFWRPAIEMKDGVVTVASSKTIQFIRPDLSMNQFVGTPNRKIIALSDGNILAGTRDGHIYVLSSSGQVMSDFQSSDREDVESSMTPAELRNGNLLLGAQDGHVDVFTRKGVLLDRIATEGLPVFSKTFASGITVVATSGYETSTPFDEVIFLDGDGHEVSRTQIEDQVRFPSAEMPNGDIVIPTSEGSSGKSAVRFFSKSGKALRVVELTGMLDSPYAGDALIVLDSGRLLYKSVDTAFSGTYLMDAQGEILKQTPYPTLAYAAMLRDGRVFIHNTPNAQAGPGAFHLLDQSGEEISAVELENREWLTNGVVELSSGNVLVPEGRDLWTVTPEGKSLSHQTVPMKNSLSIPFHMQPLSDGRAIVAYWAVDTERTYFMDLLFVR